MNYRKLTDVERGICIELLGSIIGKSIAVQADVDLEGLSRLAYLAAWQELVNLLTEEQRALVESYEPPM